MKQQGQDDIPDAVAILYERANELAGVTPYSASQIAGGMVNLAGEGRTPSEIVVAIADVVAEWR